MEGFGGQSLGRQDGDGARVSAREVGGGVGERDVDGNLRGGMRDELRRGGDGCAGERRSRGDFGGGGRLRVAYGHVQVWRSVDHPVADGARVVVRELADGRRRRGFRGEGRGSGSVSGGAASSGSAAAPRLSSAFPSALGGISDSLARVAALAASA